MGAHDLDAKVARPPDLEWCHAIVSDVSRTFAITIEVLDEPMASRICLGYLLCRIADTIEDAREIPPAVKVELLDTFDSVLSESADISPSSFVNEVRRWIPEGAKSDPEWRLVLETPRVIRTFETRTEATKTAMRQPMRELVQGLRLFVDRHADSNGLRIQSRDELEEYCHYAAGTVGALITNLITVESPDAPEAQLDDRGHAFGVLLQLVNISKDVYDDFHHENNVYLPASWLADEGVDPESVCSPTNRAGSAAVVRRTVGFARSFIADAETYLREAPFKNEKALAAWAIPFLLAIGTMRELSRRPADAVAPGAVKIEREEVMAIIHAVSEDPCIETIEHLTEHVANESLGTGN